MAEQNLGQAVRNTLTDVLAAFERAGTRQPPLHAEFLDTVLVVDVGPDGLAPEQWSAFVAKATTTDWEWWEDPVESPTLIRLYGDNRGLTEYQRLARSACEVLGIIDDFYADASWLKWTYLLRLIARDYPTPMLSISERLWGFDSMPKDVDSLSQQWTNGANGVEFPAHPLVQQLAHDLFTSSITAIRLLLDSDGGILLEYPNAGIEDWNPLTDLAVADPNEEEVVEEEIAYASNAQYLFCKLGNRWHIRYTEGEVVEEAIDLPDHKGFEYYQRILISGSDGITAPEVAGFEKLLAHTRAPALPNRRFSASRTA